MAKHQAQIGLCSEIVETKARARMIKQAKDPQSRLPEAPTNISSTVTETIREFATAMKVLGEGSICVKNKDKAVMAILNKERNIYPRGDPGVINNGAER